MVSVKRGYGQSKKDAGRAMSQFRVDNDNNDDEHFYVDIAGKGTVVIVSNMDGVSVDIFPFHVVDEPIFTGYVLNEDFNEEIE